MTAVLDLHPDAGHPAFTGLAEIHRLLDTLDLDTLGLDTPTGARVASGDYGHLVALTERAINRLAAVKLTLVAAADTAAVAAGTGMSGTGAWLARTTHTHGAAAAGQVALATALDGLPATEAALAAGDISPDHAIVIAATTRALPPGLHADQRAAVETRLVDQARSTDPATLRTKARRALQAVATRTATDRHHDQLLRAEEAAARARTRLTLHDNGDGTLSGHFTVPTLAGEILRKTIHQLASPRRGRPGAGPDHTGPVHHDTDWSHRHGQAFTELLEHLPTDRLHHKSAATIVVTLDHHQLHADLGAAGLDTGTEISAAEARRLACSAAIVPAVLSGASLPLDLGRSQRFFTPTQRLALATRHTTCAADGCDRPYAWCDLHHRHPWSQGGTTNLTNAVKALGTYMRGETSTSNAVKALGTYMRGETSTSNARQISLCR